MVATQGLVGLRPAPKYVAEVTSPPYDVIKPNTPLEALLKHRELSFFHVILGEKPETALQALTEKGALIKDDQPAYYVYEQSSDQGQRSGVFNAAQVSPYADKEIIRHEKTFDDKVAGRISLRKATGYTMGPVFVLTKAPLSAALEAAKQASSPEYEFTTDLGGYGDLHGIRNRVWRVLEASAEGQRIQAALAEQPFYIADGHHRYHASLLNQQSHFLCYATEEAQIQAYNRVINGKVKFSDIAAQLTLEATNEFVTPPKHSFSIYTREGIYQLNAQHVPSDVVGRLDCAILERELYPKLGLTHDLIADLKHFDYYAETALEEMKNAVDQGQYDIAVALHPVSLDELMAVADAGLSDPDIVMPEKSTFFSPKILSGLVLYKHEKS